MSRLLQSAFLLLASLAAYAQSAPEAPLEKASPLTVAIFLVLFIGSCAAYAVYAWWTNRKGSKPEEE